MDYHLHTDSAGDWGPVVEQMEPDPDGRMRVRHPGDMHEPKPYTGPLDWDDDPTLHPFVD